MKRLVDVCMAFFGALILSPVLLAVAAAVYLVSGPPVLFRQKRIGREGVPFTLLKFRTMAPSEDQDATSVTVEGDSRITSLGRFLRRTKLDELPQLWNVLTGDMSFVGPRPEVPEIVSQYSPDMLEILSVRPGITSVASLLLAEEEAMLASAADPERAYLEVLVPFKVQLAMEHVRRDSLSYDIQVLARTAWALTIGKLFPVARDQRLDALVEVMKRSS